MVKPSTSERKVRKRRQVIVDRLQKLEYDIEALYIEKNEINKELAMLERTLQGIKMLRDFNENSN